MSEIKQLSHSLKSKTRTKDVTLDENTSFESLLLSKNILKALSDSGFEKPSPIQVKALPLGRCGFDLTVKSKSGTGKTLVFTVITLDIIKIERKEPQVLILAPTREIAVQIQDVINTIGKYFKGLKVESFIGGLPIESDKAKCKTCHIAVGSPGRVKQLIQNGHLNTNFIRLFVLDEADKLMESSFQNDINEIYNSLPDKKQVIMCSATYPNELIAFLNRYMLSPTFVCAEFETPLLLGLKQFVKIVRSPPNVVQQSKAKNEELLKILSNVSFTQCLIFSNYQSRAESVSNFLNRNGWNTNFISAAQTQADRLIAVSSLKDFKCRILISTDLTSRGIDAANVDLVINYDIPTEAITYLHRMGRAGRYGSSGICVNLALLGQDVKILQTIMGVIGGHDMSMPILDDSLNIENEMYFSQENLLFGVVPENIEELSSKCKNEIFDMKQNSITESKRKTKSHKNQDIKADMSDSAIIEKVVEEKLSDVDVSDVLGQLASGTFNMDMNPKQCTKNTDIKDLYELLNSSPESNIENDLKFTNKSNNTKDSENLNSLFILQQLAEKGQFSGILEDKKRKRSVSSANSPSPDSFKNKEPKNDVYCKNRALFSVAKSLSNVETNQDDTDSLTQYLTMLKTEEISEVVNILMNEDGNENFREVKQDENENKSEFTEVLENIFSLAYSSAVCPNAKRWQDYLPENEKKKLVKCVGEEEGEDQEQEEYFEDEDYCDENDDYNFEMEKEIEINYGETVQQSSSQDDYSFMKWVPVDNTQKNSKHGTLENRSVSGKSASGNNSKRMQIFTENYSAVPTTGDSSNSYYEQYSPYYWHCNENLWQTGLSFDNVQNFDEWYCFEWQRQISAVRNFVQQKIYVEEMSRYQESQGKGEGKYLRDTF